MRLALLAPIGAVVALLAVAAPAGADLDTLLAACAPKDGVVVCDDGVPAAGGREPNPGAARAVAVPAAYQGHEGLPPKDPGAAAAVPGNAGGDVALDADLALPASPPPPGGRPLVVLMHGCCSGNKTDYQTSSRSGGEADKLTPSSELWHYNDVWFARRGYAVLAYTSRGFATTTPSGDEGSTGETQIQHRAFEMNDLQHLVGRLVDEPTLGIDPARVAVVGGSYGGGFGWNALTDPRWRSPGGRDVRLAAVVTKYGWTDLAYSLVPTGMHLPGRLVPANGGATLAPLGMLKTSFGAALFAAGTAGAPGTSGRHATFPPAITQALACLEGPDPDQPCPGRDETVRSFAADRSAYYQNAFFERLAADPSLATPVFAAGTFSDQLFTAIETIRMVDRLQAVRPGYPVQQHFGDYLHATQNKPKEWADLCGADRHVCKAGETDVVQVGVNSRVNAFLDHHLRPSANPAAPAPPSDVTASLYVCRANAGPGQPLDEPGPRVQAPSFAALASHALRATFEQPQTTTSSVSGNERAVTADPVFNAARNGGGCPTATGRAPAGVAVYETAPLTSARTMVGLGRVSFRFRATGDDERTLQLNTRLYDVAPGGTATLVDRGVRRLTAAAGDVTYALHGQAWRFEAGHAIRLEVTQDDDPYVRRTTAPSQIAITRAALALPVREADATLSAAPAPRCDDPVAVRRADARPSGGGLRLVVPAGAGRVVVDVFRQSAGRLVLGERRVVRLRRARTFRWSGRGAASGFYAVRFTDARGRSARVGLERRGGRFRRRPAYSTADACSVARRFSLERPVFGGVRNRPLLVAYRLGADARARVEVLRGARVLRRSADRAVAAGVLVRLRVPSEAVPRGDVRVRLVVRTGRTTTTRTLVARRL